MFLSSTPSIFEPNTLFKILPSLYNIKLTRYAFLLANCPTETAIKIHTLPSPSISINLENGSRRILMTQFPWTPSSSSQNFHSNRCSPSRCCCTRSCRSKVARRWRWWSWTGWCTASASSSWGTSPRRVSRPSGRVPRIPSPFRKRCDRWSLFGYRCPPSSRRWSAGSRPPTEATRGRTRTDTFFSFRYFLLLLSPAHGSRFVRSRGWRQPRPLVRVSCSLVNTPHRRIMREILRKRKENKETINIILERRTWIYDENIRLVEVDWIKIASFLEKRETRKEVSGFDEFMNGTACFLDWPINWYASSGVSSLG